MLILAENTPFSLPYFAYSYLNKHALNEYLAIPEFLLFSYAYFLK